MQGGTSVFFENKPRIADCYIRTSVIGRRETKEKGRHEGNTNSSGQSQHERGTGGRSAVTYPPNPCHRGPRFPNFACRD
jgi:hypothetical protein